MLFELEVEKNKQLLINIEALIINVNKNYGSNKEESIYELN